MKNKISDKLALGAVGAAVSLVFILLSYYVPTMKVSFNALASFGTMLPLLKGYYREAALSAIAAIVIALFLVNIYVLPFALVGGIYTIATVFAERKRLKPYITIPVKIVYAAFLFFVFYQLSSFIAVDFSKLGALGNVPFAALYVIMTAVFAAAFIVYDYVLILCYRYIKKRFNFD